MSGGSWEYFYHKLDDVGARLVNETEQMDESGRLRRTLGLHLIECAEVMRVIEWVDSCDTSPGSEDEPIRKLLNLKGDESAPKLNLRKMSAQEIIANSAGVRQFLEKLEKSLE